MDMTVKIQMGAFGPNSFGIVKDLVQCIEDKYAPEKISIIKRYNADQPEWAVAVTVEGDDKMAGIIQQDATARLNLLVGDTQGTMTTKNGVPETALPL